VGSKDHTWSYNINKEFIVFHFTAFQHALSCWSSGAFKAGIDFNRHNVLGMQSPALENLANIHLGTYSRLSAEWDNLSSLVQRKLCNDLQEAVRSRQRLDGSVKVANQRPFKDQILHETDFLNWRPPVLEQLRNAREENDPSFLDLRTSRTPSPTPALTPPVDLLPPSADLPTTKSDPPQLGRTASTEQPSSAPAPDATEQDCSDTSEDPFEPAPDRPRRPLPWKTPAIEKIGEVSVEPEEDRE
jgi:hypothetical protein